jgi:cell division protein FtsI/penicillin-binding protein 2
MIATAVILLASGLYEQALSKILGNRYPGAEFLLLDARTGRSVIQQWRDADRAIPVGSLWKPLLVAAKHDDKQRECRPGMCWMPEGHGLIGVIDALAHSCNAWFLAHAADLAPGTIESFAMRMGLPAPPEAVPETLIGLNPDWTVQPATIARAYLRVIAESPSVRRGMERSVASGTAHRLGVNALAKTGTASCSHAKRGPGDGFVIVLWPNVDSRYLLLVRMHGTTGAVAADTAGAIMRVIRDGR